MMAVMAIMMKEQQQRVSTSIIKTVGGLTYIHTATCEGVVTTD